MPSVHRLTPRHTPLTKSQRPVSALAVANEILDVAQSLGSPTNLPRLHRLVPLCDHVSITQTGHALVLDAPSHFGGLWYFQTVHDAFRHWNCDPIKEFGCHGSSNIHEFAEIDPERMAIIRAVVQACAGKPTYSIPRVSHHIPYGAAA